MEKLKVLLEGNGGTLENFKQNSLMIIVIFLENHCVYQARMEERIKCVARSPEINEILVSYRRIGDKEE